MTFVLFVGGLLLSFWLRNSVKGGAARMLQALADAYPHPLSREDLGASAGISPTSGTFGTYIATLKRNGLINVNGEGIRISDELR